jgi:DNA-binding MarR family transcriptional regulator
MSMAPRHGALFQSLRRSARKLDRLVSTALSDRQIDLNFTNYQILHILFERSGSSQCELAKALEISQPSLTAALAMLERRQAVRRTRDRTDRRRSIVVITDKGRKLLVEAEAAAEGVYARVAANLGSLAVEAAGTLADRLNTVTTYALEDAKPIQE